MGKFMDARQIRQANLRMLTGKFADTKVEFANKFEFSESYFGQLLMDPGKKTARNIGHKTARNIETALGLEYGELDHLMNADKKPGIDVDKLTGVIDGFGKALEKISGDLEGINLSALIAGTYDQWDGSESKPDYDLLLQGAILVGGGKKTLPPASR